MYHLKERNNKEKCNSRENKGLHIQTSNKKHLNHFDASLK